MLQLAAWVGAPGLTLLTLLLAMAPALGRRGLAGGGALLAAWAGFGALAARTAEVPAAPGVQVVLVQGNVPQGQKWDQAFASSAWNRYLRLTRAAVAAAPPGALAVVWPETASIYPLQPYPEAREDIVAASGRAAAMLVGSITFPKGRYTALDDPANLPQNSLVALRPDASVAGIYSKWHLVPFGEFAPSWVPLSIKIVPGNLGFGTRARELHASRGAAVRRDDLLRGDLSRTGGGRVGPAGLAGERHQRRVVRQLDRPAPASGGRADAGGGGRGAR